MPFLHLRACQRHPKHEPRRLAQHRGICTSHFSVLHLAAATTSATSAVLLGTAL